MEQGVSQRPYLVGTSIAKAGEIPYVRLVNPSENTLSLEERGKRVVGCHGNGGHTRLSNGHGGNHSVCETVWIGHRPTSQVARPRGTFILKSAE